MVNKTSPGGGGGQKIFFLNYQYFFKKGVFKGGRGAKGGDPKKYFPRSRAQIVPPPQANALVRPCQEDN